MKKLLLLILLIAVITAAACTSLADVNEIEKNGSNEQFEIILHLNKDVYSQNEQIECYAQLKYLG